VTLTFTTAAHKPYASARCAPPAPYSLTTVFLDLMGKKQNQMSTMSDKKKDCVQGCI